MNAGKAIKPPNGNIVNTLEQETRGSVNVESPILKQKSLAFVYLPSEHSKKTDSHVDDSVKTDTPSGRGVTAEAALTSDACGIRADPILTADHFDSAMNTSGEGSSPSRLENLVDFEPFFQEGYCKALDLDAADSSGIPCQTENPEADDEDDELLGGMFSFSEEGRFCRFIDAAIWFDVGSNSCKIF